MQTGWRTSPGFLLATTLAAGLFVAVAGLVTELTLDKSALAAARRAQALEGGQQRAEARGWRQLGANRLVERRVASTDFRLSLAAGELRGAPASEGAQRRALAVLDEELRRYPPAFLKHAGLQRVVLCGTLTQRGIPISSLPNVEGALLLDVETGPSFLRRLIHHELFHFMDFADDRQLGEDPRWRAVNDRHFSYGAGGLYQRSPSAGSWAPALRSGFLSGYSQAALEEDKAEVFSFLMVSPGRVRELAAQVPSVSKKVDLIREQLAAFSAARGVPGPSL